jgi:hypothetical protein
MTQTMQGEAALYIYSAIWELLQLILLTMLSHVNHMTPAFDQ